MKPAMLHRVAFRPRLQNSHRADAWRRCEPFLKWLRGRDCFLTQTGGCAGSVCAAHFDPWGDKGMGLKVSDSASIPMCSGSGGHHDEQHRLGWPAFQRKYEFDGRDVVTMYWLEWLCNTPMGRAWSTRISAMGGATDQNLPDRSSHDPRRTR